MKDIKTIITAFFLFMVLIMYITLFKNVVTTDIKCGSVAASSMAKMISFSILFTFVLLTIYNAVFLYYNYGKLVTFDANTILLGQLVILIMPCVFNIAMSLFVYLTNY